MINLKVKTLDSQTYDFTVDNETTVRQFKETIAEKTKISADLQRIIYCGRVLVDEKPLKEYDVNGKVVHVVERPPPSARTLASSSTTNENTRRRNGPQIRGTPIFRGLDGMVVDTITIPMNEQSQGNIPTLNPSSFCMNRITVARHMLDCVNNIISYLEHPERGLNNSTLDILTQGRFTMESTVVEVGISAASNIDLTQNQTQNFMDVFRGALSAALRQDRRQNQTVLQLPTVFNSDGTPIVNAANATIFLESALDMPQQETSQPAEPSSSDDQGEENATTSDENATQSTNNESGTSATARDAENPTTSNDSSNNGASSRSNSSRRSNSQQRTRTQALAVVVEQMRTTQTRLEPYVQQYYDILENEPQFEENDSAGRESAQRIFDRVSEAMHYMSHALHAISDLMLDLSQNTPRYLSCRPILVEQSGFVSSNNYLASFMQPSNEGGGMSVNPPTNNNSSQNQSGQSATVTPTGINANGGGGGGGRSTTTATPENSSNASSATTPTAGDEQPIAEIVLNMPRRVIIPTNPQLQVARLIQAVVNSAPMDADLHVQINAPNLLSVGIPIGAAVRAAGPFSSATAPTANQPSGNASSGTTQPTAPASSTSTSNAGNTTNSTETENNQEQPRVTTATHPTTSTQTRSTPRPQVHVANMPSSWSYRDIPENMFSSFDRFLPCSSHHIRDNENNSNITETVNEGSAPAMPNIVIPNILYRTRPQVRRRRANIFSPVVRTPAGTTVSSSTDAARPSNETNETNNNSANRPTQNSTEANARNQNTANEIQSLSNDELNIPMSIFGSNLTLRDLIEIAPSPNLLNRIRGELLTCIVDNLFSGSTINEENMSNAINTFIQMLNDVLMFLPQFDLPDYDARASVENFLRNRIPFIINLIHEDSSDEFGTRFLRELIQFAHRLLMILLTCVGRNNAELYLNQISQMAISSEVAEEQEPLRTLHRHLMSAITRQLDMTAQNTIEVQQYLVIRRPATENGQTTATTTTITPMETDDVPPPVTNNITSNPLIEVTGLSLPNPNQRPTDDPLPSITVGSEQWHSNFPASWLPIITRDTERQRRQTIQAPFSDAYISGMSAKRRKLISNTKSPTDVPLLIADGIKKTIQLAGVSTQTTTTSSTSNNNGNLSSTNNININSSTNNINDISVAIASDSVTQSSYIEALRTSIQDRLKNDQNYDPKKFPNSSKYFTK